MSPERLLIWSQFKQFTTPVLLAIGLVLITLALFLNYFISKQSVSVEKSRDTIVKKIIKVDIEGAVERPGVYEVTNDSRIQDVLITAGGMTAKANRKYISENINLSQRVYDGQKIFIPETNPLRLDRIEASLSNLISINTATEQELDILPGIGLVTARKIISGRPYQNISELVEKHLINQTTFNKIKDKISL